MDTGTPHNFWAGLASANDSSATSGAEAATDRRRSPGLRRLSRCREQKLAGLSSEVVGIASSSNTGKPVEMRVARSGLPAPAEQDWGLLVQALSQFVRKSPNCRSNSLPS